MRQLLVAILLFCVAGARAQGTLSIAPIRLQIDPGASSTSFTASLAEGEAKLLQINLVRWTRVRGEDHFEPTEALISTPPLFRLSAGGSQVVRLGFLIPPPPADIERAWRVFVEEIPDEANPPPPGQVRMALRIGLPMFVPPAKVRRNVVWRLERRDGHLEVLAENRGNVHLRVDRLELRDASAQSLLTAWSGPLYVFPGETRSFVVEHAVVASGLLHLIEQGSDRRSDHELALPSP